MNTLAPVHSSQLWIGSSEKLVEQAYMFLYKHFCSYQGCMVCSICTQIRTQQHPHIRWLAPSNLYTIEDLEAISSTIAFALEPHETFFFVLQKADYLSPACANSLLKSIEEPPLGYHFILLAERPDFILATIRSRCVITQYSVDGNLQHASPLYALFTKTHLASTALLMNEIDTVAVNERDTLGVLDALIDFWHQELILARTHGETSAHEHAMAVLSLLFKAIAQPPMPGGNKLFWRTLMMQFITLTV